MTYSAYSAYSVYYAYSAFCAYCTFMHNVYTTLYIVHILHILYILVTNNIAYRNSLSATVSKALDHDRMDVSPPVSANKHQMSDFDGLIPTKSGHTTSVIHNEINTKYDAMYCNSDNENYWKKSCCLKNVWNNCCGVVRARNTFGMFRLFCAYS